MTPTPNPQRPAELIASIRAADRGHGHISTVGAADSVVILLAEIDRLNAELNAERAKVDWLTEDLDAARGRTGPPEIPSNVITPTAALAINALVAALGLTPPHPVRWCAEDIVTAFTRLIDERVQSLRDALQRHAGLADHAADRPAALVANQPDHTDQERGR